MAAVAVGAVVRRFAAAKVEGARGLGDEPVRLQACALVRAVAERLLGRAPAGTPEIGPASLQRDLIRALLGADWVVGHGFLPRVQPAGSFGLSGSTPTPGGWTWPAPAGDVTGPPVAENSGASRGGNHAETTFSLSFSETLVPASSVQVNSNSPGPGTRM